MKMKIDEREQSLLTECVSFWPTDESQSEMEMEFRSLYSIFSLSHLKVRLTSLLPVFSCEICCVRLARECVLLAAVNYVERGS